MSGLWRYSEGFTGWVHETARAQPADRERHAAFIRRRLLAALAIAALAPPYLALRGAPAPWEALVFLLALAPVASVVVLSRTGRLVAAHALCACACILASLAIAAGVAMTLRYGVDHLSKGAVGIVDDDSDEDVLAL